MYNRLESGCSNDVGTGEYSSNMELWVRTKKKLHWIDQKEKIKVESKFGPGVKTRGIHG